VTPEEIVGLIGNIANRPDIREVQERQVKEIRALILAERKACSEIASSMSVGWYKSGEEQAGIATANVSYFIDQRTKYEQVSARQPGD